MALKLDLAWNGGTRTGLSVVELELVRRLGREVRWSATVVAPQGDRTVAELSKSVLAGGLRGRVVSDGQELIGRQDCVALGWQEEQGRIRVDSIATRVSGQHRPGRVGAFRPRHRVLRAGDLTELLAQFGHVIALPAAVANRLANLRFEHGEHGCALQYGESDWDFVGTLLEQYERLERDERWKPLLRTGGVDPAQGTAQRWMLTWPLRGAWEELGELEARSVAPEELVRLRRAFGSMIPAEAGPELASLRYPVVIEEWPDRPFSAAAWNAWGRRDLPLFRRGTRATVVAVTDQLYSADAGGLPGWRSFLSLAPDEGAMPWAHHRARPRPVLARARVTSASQQSEWLEVELEDFETEKDGARASAHLFTPSSGKDGRTGLHLVPEEGTEVVVVWDGRLGSPLWCFGNERCCPTELAAPSIVLQHSLGLALQPAQGAGTIQVQGPLEIVAQRELQLRANGARIELRDGVVRTSKASTEEPA